MKETAPAYNPPHIRKYLRGFRLKKERMTSGVLTIKEKIDRLII
jgi:hypothetical protein